MAEDLRALLSAIAAEMSDIAAGVQAAGDLTGEVMGRLPSEERLSYMVRMQAFDVLTQRLDALSALADALASEQPMDTALAALPLAEMAERLQEAVYRQGVAKAPAAKNDAGELQLFD